MYTKNKINNLNLFLFFFLFLYLKKKKTDSFDEDWSNGGEGREQAGWGPQRVGAWWRHTSDTFEEKVRDGGGGHMASLIGILSCLLTHPTIVGPSIIYADMGKQSLTHLPTALPVPAKLCP